MKSIERVIKTLRFEKVDRPPRDLWTLPGIMMDRAEELEAVKKRFPMDITFAGCERSLMPYEKGVVGEIGTRVDEWGCVWEVKERGVFGEVKKPLLWDWSKLKKFKPPFEILKMSMDEVNRFVANTDAFVIGACVANPFERMQFLRGTENLFLDIGYGVKELYQLRDMVHEFFLKQYEIWAKSDVHALPFMDDWGSQKSLLISPQMWREIYKPLYKDYCDIAHKNGKFIFIHSDGYIIDIYEDLIEIGVDAINSQLFCMDIEEIGRRFKGKITFWGEIDRQNILPFGKVEDVKNAVKRVKKALWDGNGGVISQCEWGINNPMENIIAVFEEWENI